MKFSSVNFGAGIVILALWFWGFLGSLGELFSAGEPFTGLLGLIFVLAAFFYFFLRRTGVFPHSKGLWAEVHILLGYAGVGLVIIHSGGAFFTWTGLLTLSLALIFLLGLNLRFFSGRQCFRNFPSRLHLFANPVQKGMDLGLILEKKKAFLQDMDHRAVEGVFGLRLKDWLSHPWKAGRYLSLVRIEKNRVQETCGRPPAYLRLSQDWGRYVHIVLGVGMVAGLLAHLFRSCPYFSF
jgi:hypothetical protein